MLALPARYRFKWCGGMWSGVTVEYRVTYDPVADALYVRVRDGEVADTVEVAEGVIVDLDREGRVLGIEILGYSKSEIDLDEIVKRGVEAVVVLK